MDEIVGGLAEVPDAGDPVNPLLAALETLFFDRAPASPFRPSLSQYISGVDVYRNGIVVFDAGAERFRANYYLLAPEDVTTCAYEPAERAKAIATMYQNKRVFVVEDGALSEVTGSPLTAIPATPTFGRSHG